MEEHPRTITARYLVKLIENEIKEYGDLPVYISDNHGELSLTDNAIRFSSNLGYKEAPTDKEMKTFNGRFFILSNL